MRGKKGYLLNKFKSILYNYKYIFFFNVVDKSFLDNVLTSSNKNEGLGSYFKMNRGLVRYLYKTNNKLFNNLALTNNSYMFYTNNWQFFLDKSKYIFNNKDFFVFLVYFLLKEGVFPSHFFFEGYLKKTSYLACKYVKPLHHLFYDTFYKNVLSIQVIKIRLLYKLYFLRKFYGKY